MKLRDIDPTFWLVSGLIVFVFLAICGAFGPPPEQPIFVDKDGRHWKQQSETFFFPDGRGGIYPMFRYRMVPVDPPKETPAK